jgi:hypothetical protein
MEATMRRFQLVATALTTAGLWMCSALAQESAPAPQTQPALASVELASLQITPAAAPEAAPVVQPAAPAGPDALASAAAVYATYQNDVTQVRDNPFRNAGDIEAALTNLGTQNHESLTRGFVAYSSLVASQTPEFVAAVREAEAYYGADRLVRGMRNDARYVRSFAGADRAISRALTAISVDARRVTSTGAIVKEQAYSLQSQGWAKALFPNAARKADSLKAASLLGRTPDSRMLSALSAPDLELALGQAGDEGSSLWDGLSVGSTTLKLPTLGLGGLMSAPIRTVSLGRENTADRIATLAAFRAIGATSSTYASDMSPILLETQTSNCMEKAKLNLNQCVHAAHNQFEVPFCIGEFALTEVGQCMGNVAQ